MNMQTAKFIAALPCGFITDKQLPQLIELDRLQPCLVRCGGVRFECGAQYLTAMLAMVEASGDYVRDVSIPAGDMDQARAIVLDNAELPGEVKSRQLPESPAVEMKRARAAHHRALLGHIQDFDEQDCSGVFDGHQVMSDADSGL
jgi:hypothetical protein